MFLAQANIIEKDNRSFDEIMKDVIVRPHLTTENLGNAYVVHFKESLTERWARGFLSESARIKRDRDFFSVDEYPAGVDLYEDEIGASVLIRHGKAILVRYTEKT